MLRKRKRSANPNQEPVCGPGWSSYLPTDGHLFLIYDYPSGPELSTFDAELQEEEDESFDQLCWDLLTKNYSRYQEQTLELLAKGLLELNLNGFEYEYRLEKHDVSFRFAAPSETELKEYARTYVHRKRSQKMEYIPLFFARCEATLFVD